MIKMLLPLSIALLFTGCTALHQSSPVAAVYDFGSLYASPAGQSSQLPQLPQSLKRSLMITDADAPSWLNTTAIHYRLLYHNPAQTYTYANSRWIAPPAALFTQQLRNRIASQLHEPVTKDSSTAKTGHVLNIELEEFVQLFDTAADSRVVIGLRASLIERNSRKLLAQRDFSVSENAPAADAAGAVAALNAASHRLINEMIGWINDAALPD